MRTVSVKVFSICLTAVASVVVAMGVQVMAGPVVSGASAESAVTAPLTDSDTGTDVGAKPEDDQWT